MTLPKSADLKLGRAREHVKALEAAVETFLYEEVPYAAHREVQNEGTDHVLIWDRYTAPPDSIGLILGDAIHNLRSSLDHMVVALAEAGAQAQGITMTAEQIARLQFPVVRTKTDFTNQINRGRLLHVYPAAQAYIESRQVYKADQQLLQRDLLTELTELDNTDKHRALTIAGLNTAVVQTNWPVGLRSTQLQLPPQHGTPEPGAEMGRFVFLSPQSEADLPVSFEWGLGLVYSKALFFHRVEYTVDLYFRSVEFMLTTLSQWA